MAVAGQETETSYLGEVQLINAGTPVRTANPLPVVLSAGALILGTVDIDQTTPGTTNGVVVNSGTVTTVTTVGAVTAITNALPAGTNTIGHAVADAAATAGGITTTARLPSAANSTNATNVKTSAGRIYSVCGKNNAAYDVFLVLYDSATNPPVPATTTIRKKMVCPASAAFVYDWPLGLSCSAGIGYAFTKLVADADTTVLVAADVTAFNLDYV